MARDSTDALVAQAAVQCAEAMARAILVTVDECQSNERPLSMLQQIDLVKTALSVFDGTQAELASAFETITVLSGMGKS